MKKHERLVVKGPNGYKSIALCGQEAKVNGLQFAESDEDITCVYCYLRKEKLKK